jgi:transcriptional regulator with XRE-family HTH domain
MASKLTYSAIANQANCSPATVSNIAAGETRFPRFSTVFNILAALGFDVVVR